MIAEAAEGLEHFQDLECYGCKFGKEGFAIVTEVSEVFKLEHQTVEAHPSTLLPMEALLNSGQFVGGCDIYNLYRYQWADNIQTTSDRAGFLDQTPTAADGFVPFVAAYFPTETSHLPKLDYYTNREINIPVALVNLLRGGVYA